MADELKYDIKDFLKKKKAVVLDDSGAARSTIRKMLVAMGCDHNSILATKNFKEAQKFIENERAEIVFTDFNVGPYYGLDLLETHQKVVTDPMQRLFILVTANTDESNVAEAAEEDVDAYLLKPFSKTKLEAYIKNAITAKARPSEYTVKISEGKVQMAEGKTDDASDRFGEAKELSKKPTLACYYNANVKELEEDMDTALNEYEKGLEFNDIHYKCLTGKFDILDGRNKRKEAYEVIKTLVKHFPISPKRLGKIFKLAVYTENFEDVQKYFDLYKTLERRSPELTNIVAAGMMVAGKYHLSRGNKSEAAHCFLACVKTSGMDLNYILKTFEACLKADMLNIAKTILNLFPNAERTTDLYHYLEFCVSSFKQVDDNTLQQGFELTKEGIPYEKVYEVVISEFKKRNQETKAETVLYKAIEVFPDKRDYFNKLFG